MTDRKLPVYEQKDRILEALKDHQVVVVESPTGSGKTTQLPLILYESGLARKGIIGVTQPRRIAAMSVSGYIANQLNTQISETVGYTIRFEDQTSPQTKIKIMTDGILLQELKTDKLLSRYSCIIVDEAHERSLNIDFILGLLKYILRERPDFKVIVSSATINAQVFSEYFNNCPVVYIDSLMFPVDIIYDPPLFDSSEESLLEKIYSIIRKEIEKDKKEGDFLIFLSGEKQIKNCISFLEASSISGHLKILPLYGRLSKEEQEKVFFQPPKNKRKVIVATNIAETSVTIDGITVVIDSGLAKMNYYNPRTYTSSLIENPISRASCDQRRGRSGRTRPGVCYRLYTKDDYTHRPLYTLEDIYRTDLAEVVLRMADIGINDFEQFDFISPPGKQGIFGAIETLLLLNGITEDLTLTETGKLMIRFPLLPRHSRMIIESIHRYPDVLEETLIAASFLSSNTPFLLPIGEEINARKAHHSFRSNDGDFISYIDIYKKYQKARNKSRFCTDHYLDERIMAEIVNIKQQLEDLVSSLGVPILSGGPVSSYLCSVSKGLIQYVCIRSGRTSYRSLTAEKIYIHPGSVMFKETPQIIVAGEIVRTSKMFARSVSPLQRKWLHHISPSLAAELLTFTGKGLSESGKKPGKDTTWTIRISGQEFALKPYKGKKKIAVLPWENIKKILSRIEPDDFHRYRNIRSKVIFNGKELLSGEKLGNTFRILKYINPEHDFVNKWKSNKNYFTPENTIDICRQANLIVKISSMRKKKSLLGFIALITDGEGRYWMRCIKSFNSAVSQSLSSLEMFIDQLGDDIPDSCLEQINSIYRKLSEFYERY